MWWRTNPWWWNTHIQYSWSRIKIHKYSYRNVSQYSYINIQIHIELYIDSICAFCTILTWSGSHTYRFLVIPTIAVTWQSFSHTVVTLEQKINCQCQGYEIWPLSKWLMVITTMFMMILIMSQRNERDKRKWVAIRTVGRHNFWSILSHLNLYPILVFQFSGWNKFKPRSSIIYYHRSGHTWHQFPNAKRSGRNRAVHIKYIEFANSLFMFFSSVVWLHILSLLVKKRHWLQKW